MWLDLMSAMRQSMTCSRGSTCPASLRSSREKARVVMSRISPRAAVRVRSSSSAWGEKRMPLSWISSAAFHRFTAWSPMRSKSPMVCSCLDTFRLSVSDRALLLRRTRVVPSLSS